MFAHPNGQDLYVADGSALRKIVISGAAVTTVAGVLNSAACSSNGQGSAACFNGLVGLASNSAGTLMYLGDRVRATGHCGDLY